MKGVAEKEIFSPEWKGFIFSKFRIKTLLGPNGLDSSSCNAPDLRQKKSRKAFRWEKPHLET